MDLPPWVNQPSSSSDDGDDVGRRLTAIDNALRQLNERLDGFATSLEASVREAVAKDVERVATDLRHTVSDLGRLLVRDLGRLNKILTEHRDSIVAEVKGRPAAPAAEPSMNVPPRSPEGASIPVADGGDDTSEDADARSVGWRRRRREP